MKLEKVIKKMKIEVERNAEKNAGHSKRVGFLRRIFGNG